MAFPLLPMRVLPPQGTCATEPSTPWPEREGWAWSRCAAGVRSARERVGTGGEEEDE